MTTLKPTVVIPENCTVTDGRDEEGCHHFVCELGTHYFIDERWPSLKFYNTKKNPPLPEEGVEVYIPINIQGYKKNS